MKDWKEAVVSSGEGQGPTGWQKTKMSRVRWRKRTLEDRQFVHKDKFTTAETEIGGTGVLKSLNKKKFPP